MFVQLQFLPSDGTWESIKGAADKSKSFAEKWCGEFDANNNTKCIKYIQIKSILDQIDEDVMKHVSIYMEYLMNYNLVLHFI